MGTVLVLILGWLLGLLSPAIVDTIKCRREARRGREAIRAELDELSRVLVVASFQAQKAAGTIDRPFLEWLAQCLRRDASSQVGSLLAAVEAGLSATDDELAVVAPLMATPGGKATMLQHYPAPLLDSRVSALWTFDTEYQRRLLEIKKDTGLLAGIVEQSREYYRLTFSEMSSENHDRAASNLQQCYGNYAERARIIVDHIAALPSKGEA